MVFKLKTKKHVLILGLFSLTVICTIDFLLPFGVAIGLLYLLSILIVSDLTKKTILAFGVSSIFLVLLKLVVFYKTDLPIEIIILNRSITILAIVLGTWFALKRKSVLNTHKKIKKKNFSLLKKQNSRLEELITAINTHLNVSITDLDGKILYANKKFCEVYNYSFNEIIGKTHHIVNSDFHSKELVKNMWDTMLGGKTWVGEIKNVNKDGEYFWSEIVNIPMTDENGKITKFLSTRKDITEKMYHEEQLMKEKKDLEHFAYIATHDLKSPIINLETLLQFLEEETSFNEEGQFLMTNINTSVKKIQDTISNLNEVIKQKKSISDTSEKLSLNDEFELVLDGVEQVIKEHNIDVHYDFTEIPTIFFPKLQLHSIFQNFLTNSIKYRRTDIQTLIEISSRRHDDQIQLMFKDNGMGINLDLNKDKLFGLFKRFHDTKEEGKGIGLHIVKHIVDSNHGTIEVESKVNEGTTFILSFKNEIQTSEDSSSKIED
jgi:PAS domain S-box-containing protein